MEQTKFFACSHQIKSYPKVVNKESSLQELSTYIFISYLQAKIPTRLLSTKRFITKNF